MTAYQEPFDHHQWRIAVLTNPNLSDAAKVDLLFRGEHYDFEARNGTGCTISQSRIAASVGHQRQTVNRSDHAGIEQGLLLVTNKADGQKVTYRLVRPVTPDGQVPVTLNGQVDGLPVRLSDPTCHSRVTGPVTPDGHEYSSKTVRKQTPSALAPLDADEDLRSWWSGLTEIQREGSLSFCQVNEIDIAQYRAWQLSRGGMT